MTNATFAYQSRRCAVFQGWKRQYLREKAAILFLLVWMWNSWAKNAAHYNLAAMLGNVQDVFQSLSAWKLVCNEDAQYDSICWPMKKMSSQMSIDDNKRFEARFTCKMSLFGKTIRTAVLGNLSAISLSSFSRSLEVIKPRSLFRLFFWRPCMYLP